MRARCVDCEPAVVELCLACLATGREPGSAGVSAAAARGPAASHRRGHRYRVLDNLAAMRLFERA